MLHSGLALWAVFYFLAIVAQVFLQVGWAYSTLSIARNGMIDELGVRQVQARHDLPEPLQRNCVAQGGLRFFSWAIVDTRRSW